MIVSQLADLKNQRVFVRADLNVPLKDGQIVNDFRLKAIQPTLDLLISQQARIILATHLGRPQGVDRAYSTEQLLPWFIEQGYTIHWTDMLTPTQVSPGQILLLENLRFWQGETTPDQSFAKQLHALADYYVNDAFGLLHQEATSITVLPTLYPPSKRTIGLRVALELHQLQPLVEPISPFTVVLGGAKVKDKLPLIEPLLDRVTSVLVLPPVAFTFLKAQGINVGRSLVEDDLLERARRIMAKADQQGVQLLLPDDFLYAQGHKDGTLVLADAIPNTGYGICLGPRSLSRYREVIHKAQTIFLNGTMGFFEREETMAPFYQLLEAIAQSSAYSVVGGGESVAAVYACQLQNDISFCSVGGGATLYYIAHHTLPALRYF